jgi:hypothetical protein
VTRTSCLLYQYRLTFEVTRNIFCDCTNIIVSHLLLYFDHWTQIIYCIPYSIYELLYVLLVFSQHMLILSIVIDYLVNILYCNRCSSLWHIIEEQHSIIRNVQITFKILSRSFPNATLVLGERFRTAISCLILYVFTIQCHSTKFGSIVIDISNVTN